MLIELKVKNFRSICDEQTLSLLASPAAELDQNTFYPEDNTDLHLVRAAVIYGANAGGKSTLLSALLVMREFVLFSAKESQQGDMIPVESFLFENTSRKEPSELEVIFMKDGVKYQYGFIADKNQIFEEWLFAYPLSRPQQWFSRVYDRENNEYAWKFSSKYFKGGKQVSDLTRKNVLFLSNAVKLNNEQLAGIFDWFQKDLIPIDPLSRLGLSNTKSLDYLETESGKKRILKLMSVADPSIADIVTEKHTEDDLPPFPDHIPKEVQDALKKEVLSRLNTKKISFMHNNMLLNFRDESDGTCRLFAFAGYWLEALDEGRVLIVDEINSSLHPLVVKFLINLIYDPAVNVKNAQLIFTTHDTSLLDNELFRRDQVWFVEKDKNNSTQVYPLLDFSPRRHEAFSRGYLQGRYGALPYIGDWKF